MDLLKISDIQAFTNQNKSFRDIIFVTSGSYSTKPLKKINNGIKGGKQKISLSCITRTIYTAQQCHTHDIYCTIGGGNNATKIISSARSKTITMLGNWKVWAGGTYSACRARARTRWRRTPGACRCASCGPIRSGGYTRLSGLLNTSEVYRGTVL